MGSINLLEARRNILMSQPHLTTESANPLTFQTDISANLKDCKIYFEPIQEGSGDPSPENVRPINGWDGVTVYKTGKNLFDASRPLLSGWLNIDGTTGGTSGSGNKHTYKIPVKEGCTYTYSASIMLGTNRTSLWYDDNNNILGYFTLLKNTKVITATAPTGAKYVSLTIYNTTGQQIQLELGSEATAYEPYTGTSITIPFPQTIYGGYVDLVNGEVVEEWSQIASYNSETLPGEWMSDRDVYTAGTSPTIGAQVAYKLATPITHQLTRQTIRTLRGVNNVWSDANGEIEIKYWKH